MWSWDPPVAAPSPVESGSFASVKNLPPPPLAAHSRLPLLHSPKKIFLRFLPAAFPSSARGAGGGGAVRSERGGAGGGGRFGGRRAAAGSEDQRPSGFS
jgi:hypothetical protein